MRNFVASLGVLSFAALIAAGCGPFGNEIPDEAVCRVGDELVTKKAYRSALDGTLGQLKARTGEAPKKNTDQWKSVRAQVVNELVRDAARAAEAQRVDISVSEKDVEKELETLIERSHGGDESRLKQQLEVEGRSMADLRRSLRSQLLFERLQARERSSTKVNDKQLQAFLDEHPEQFGGKPRSRVVQHVLIRPNGKAGAADDAAAKAFVERAIKQLGGKPTKPEVARISRSFSDDPSYGPLGGTLEYHEGTIGPEFSEAAFNLDVGAISEPVKTDLGWHLIVARSQVREAKVPKLASVNDQVSAAARTDIEAKKIDELQQRIDKFAKDADCLDGYRDAPEPKPAQQPKPGKEATPPTPGPDTRSPDKSTTPESATPESSTESDPENASPKPDEE